MTLRELFELLQSKRSQFDAMSKEATPNMEELRSLNQEILDLNERIKLMEEQRNLHIPDATIGAPEKTATPEASSEVRSLSNEDLDKEYEGAFIRAFRRQKLSQRDMELYHEMEKRASMAPTVGHFESSVDANGGFIVPKAVSTMIQEYKRQGQYDLSKLVDVTFTAVLSGTFTYEKLAEITPFANISQWDEVPEVEPGKFETKTYTIKDYGGILPIPRTLLQDTDQNLMAYVARFIAKKSIATRNKKILDVLTATYTGVKVALADIKAIKKVINVTLDAAFLPTAKIITNQDGFDFLDSLEDKNGHGYIEDDVKDPTKKRLKGLEIVVLPNGTLKTNTKKVPVFIGDSKEALRLYDRGVYEVATTDIGGKAFLRNSTDVRVIDRFDVISLDKDALIACEITLP